MYIVVFVTCANKKEAEEIASFLVRKKLAGCVNIIEKIDSIFWWQKKIEKTKESLLIIKSKGDKFAQLIKMVKRIHSYRVPEIIAIKIFKGEKDYLNWLDGYIK
ncbi:MAG: divalent-cation tolerance protein CutA [Candidatus Omnitrophica bacterium]|nr:divalent-cation tolerance protein CutA [Candidatus Omnitrophota bacterium]